MSNHDWYYDLWAYNYCRAYKNDNNDDEYDNPDDYVMEREVYTEDEEDDLFE